MTDTLLSLARMARTLGVTQAWLQAEAEAGRVPHLMADRRYLFAPESVRRCLAARAAQTEGRTDD